MSLLYQPHRGLGVYSSGIPLVIKPIETGDFYLISALQNYFSVFRFSDLAIIGTSDRLDENIISMSSTKNLIFCGCQTKIFAFKRAKHICQKFSYKDKRNWKIVVVLENNDYLCGVCETNMLVIWNISSGKEIFTSQFPENDFDICQVIQPKGYTNKILVASKCGQFHIINFKTKSTLYIFNLEKVISIVQQTPDNDTIAIGCDDGTVLLHNILYDKTIINLRHDLGAISSICFREETPNELIMLTGSENGHVAMWNIDKGRNIGQSRNCHQSVVSTLFCVPGKPLLISNSPDNSIKVWNYDRPDGTPLLLKSRQGHWMPPSFVDYWPSGTLSTQIISGGYDGVINVFSTFEEKNNFSMGRGYLPHHGKREDKLTRDQYVLPAAKDIASNAVRDGFWDSIAVCHKGHRQVSTWTFSKRCRGKHYLDYSKFQKSEFKFHKVSATHCALSICGNFVIVAYTSGHLVKYNIQSGEERGEYGDTNGHDEEVTGLIVGLSGDSMVVVSVDASGKVCMWDLVSKKLISELLLHTSITSVHVHPNKGMVAVATSDGFVHLIQLMNLVVFQRIKGSLNGHDVKRITFTNSNERMVIADGNLIKTFDYIHQKLVDCFMVHKTVTNIIISPNDSFLVTTHEDDLGVYLWALKTQCRDIKLPSLNDDYTPEKFVELPSAMTVEDVDLDSSMFVSSTVKEYVPKISNRLTTFTSQPSSYLANLLNVEHIKVKSEMTIRGASSSSFFLPQMMETLEGIKWKDEENNKQQIFEQDKKRKFDETKNSDIVTVENLHSQLIVASSDQEYDECMSVMSKLTAASVDHEIKMMHPMYHMDKTTDNLRIDAFLRLLINQFSRQRSVDLCQMFLAVLLKQNFDCLVQIDEVNEDDDPLNMNEDAMNEIAEVKNNTLELVNIAVNHMTSSRQLLMSQLTQIEQMAQLASLK